MATRNALVTRVKNAALAGKIPHPFSKEDVERWMQEEDPRRPNGERYKTTASNLLSGASLKNLGSKNRNQKFLDIEFGEDQVKRYRVNPAA